MVVALRVCALLWGVLLIGGAEAASFSSSPSVSPSPSSSPGGCGNGKLDAGEQCDAGAASVAGCTAGCKFADGYQCNGDSPPKCVQDSDQATAIVASTLLTFDAYTFGLSVGQSLGMDPSRVYVRSTSSRGVRAGHDAVVRDSQCLNRYSGRLHVDFVLKGDAANGVAGNTDMQRILSLVQEESDLVLNEALCVASFTFGSTRANPVVPSPLPGPTPADKPWYWVGPVIGVSVLAFLLLVLIVVCLCNRCDKKRKAKRKAVRDALREQRRLLAERQLAAELANAGYEPAYYYTYDDYEYGDGDALGSSASGSSSGSSSSSASRSSARTGLRGHAGSASTTTASASAAAARSTGTAASAGTAKPKKKSSGGLFGFGKRRKDKAKPSTTIAAVPAPPVAANAVPVGRRGSVGRSVSSTTSVASTRSTANAASSAQSATGNPASLALQSSARSHANGTMVVVSARIKPRRGSSSERSSQSSRARRALSSSRSASFD